MNHPVIPPAPSTSLYLQGIAAKPVTAGPPETVTRARFFNEKQKSLTETVPSRLTNGRLKIRKKRGRAGAPLPGVPPPSAAPPPQDYGGAQAPRQSTRARTARHPAQPPTTTAKPRWRAVLEARATAKSKSRLCLPCGQKAFHQERSPTTRSRPATPRRHRGRNSG